MSTLKIWESVRSVNGLPILRLDERVTYQTVSFTGTAGTSAAFDGDTSVISIISDAACAVRVGTAPTAVVTDFPVSAYTTQGDRLDLEVQPGQKISVIAI